MAPWDCLCPCPVYLRFRISKIFPSFYTEPFALLAESKRRREGGVPATELLFGPPPPLRRVEAIFLPGFRSLRLAAAKAGPQPSVPNRRRSRVLPLSSFSSSFTGFGGFFKSIQWFLYCIQTCKAFPWNVFTASPKLPDVFVTSLMYV